MNTLIVIGFMGIKKCYLNIPIIEAVKRFCLDEEISIEYFNENYLDEILIFDFDDEFCAYEVYSKD